MLIELPKTTISEKPYVYDCRPNSIHELLKYHGTEILPSVLWLISDSYETCYGRINLPELALDNIPYLIDSKNDIAETVFNKLHVPYRVERLTNSQEDDRRMKALLEEKGPILIRVDERAHALNPNESESLNIRNIAIPVLLGFSEDDSQISVFWTNTNEQEPIHVFSKQQFNKFRGSTSLPYSPNYECIYIDDANAVKDIDLSQLDNLKEEALINAIRRMSESPACDPSLKQVFFTDKLYTGLDALDLMVEDFCDIARKAILPHFDREFDAYAAFVFALAKNNLHYGSVSAYREEFAAALVEFGTSRGIQEFVDSGNELKNIAGYWRNALMLFFQLQSGVNGRVIELIKLRKLLHMIRDGEHRVYDSLMKSI